MFQITQIVHLILYNNSGESILDLFSKYNYGS